MIDSPMSKLSADYLAALRLHGDDDGLETHLQMARKLGAAAVELGLGTLGLAKLHDAALTTILSAPTLAASKDATTSRASIFFNEAILPIEKTHRSALEAAVELHGINADLDQRTADLAASQRKVMREMKKRKTSEAALRTSEETAADLLVESRLLEEELREMTRRTLSANEVERERMSLHLQDEIAQTLLGIHVRLLALQKTIGISRELLAKQITSTERLMAQSVKTIGSFANTLVNHCES